MIFFSKTKFKMASAEILTSIRHPDEEFDIGRFADSISRESDVFDDIYSSTPSSSSLRAEAEMSSTTLASVSTTIFTQLVNASMLNESANGSQRLDLQVGNFVTKISDHQNFAR